MVLTLVRMHFLGKSNLFNNVLSFFFPREMKFLYRVSVFVLLMETVHSSSISVSGKEDSGSASASGNGFGCTVVDGKKHCIVSKGKGSKGGGGGGGGGSGGGGGGGGGGGSGGGWGGSW